MHRGSRLVLALSLVLTLATPGQGSAMVQAGQAAPEFDLTDTNGQAHALSDYRGKTVVLAFVGYG